MFVGIITSIASFDRETKPSYNLVVVVSDGGALSCRIDVTVDLRDVNDNEPVFDAALEPMRVREDAPVNTTLVRVTATDSDLGLYFFTSSIILKSLTLHFAQKKTINSIKYSKHFEILQISNWGIFKLTPLR